jgi:hypothetical protein
MVYSSESNLTLLSVLRVSSKLTYLSRVFLGLFFFFLPLLSTDSWGTRQRSLVTAQDVVVQLLAMTTKLGGPVCEFVLAERKKRRPEGVFKNPNDVRGVPSEAVPEVVYFTTVVTDMDSGLSAAAGCRP